MAERRGFTELSQFTLDSRAADMLPVEFCLERMVVILGPLPEASGEPIHLGALEPSNRELVADVEQRLGRKVRPVQLNAYEIRQALARIQGVPHGEHGIATKLSADRTISFDTDQPVSQMVDDLLSVAVQDGATDVHVEVYKDDVDLRFRVDGFLRQVTTPLSPENAARVVARLKVLAELDPLERRRAHDGHFSALYQDQHSARRVDFRLATVPGAYGQDAVIRVLDPTRFRLELRELGMSPDVLPRYEHLVRAANGLILITGPTVSGKTNTLYATVTDLRDRGLKVVTVEDPVEYEFEKINQKSITPDMGFPDFARAFLRHNPDVMLIGEVRDPETADVVVQAATTGHLVMSTLHTRDSVSAVGRLRALGVSDDAMSSILLGVLGQRLVPRICDGCRAETQPPDDLLWHYYEVPPELPFYAGRGCEACRGTGFSGLVALFELLEMTPALTAAVARGASIKELEELAAAEDFQPLLGDGLEKVHRGETTLQELARKVVPPYRPGTPPTRAQA